MNCLYCDSKIEKMSLTSLFLQEDLLCSKCRQQLKIERKIIDLGEFKVETFFEYDGIFKSILLQYKECMDEALKPVFLYGLDEYMNIRYHSYKLLLAPSSKSKLEKRGFNHLEGIFEPIKLERINGLRMINDLCQEGKNYEERSKMKNNYIYEGERIDKLLIVDDVLTTGSTLMGIFNVLNSKVDKIKVLSLAYKNKSLYN